MKRHNKFSWGGGRPLITLILAAMLLLGTGTAAFAVSAGDTISYTSSTNCPSGIREWTYGRVFNAGEFTGTCAEPYTAALTSGSASVSGAPSNSRGDMKKAMYYFGYVKGWASEMGNGAAYNGGYKLELMAQYIATGDNLAISGEWNGADDWKTFAQDQLAAVDWSTVNVPSSFECYYCNAESGNQNFVIWRLEPAGKLKLKKASANSNITG